jgi:hypothetical protein
MNESTTFTAGYLTGSSSISTDLDCLVAGKYDVAILVPSWDKRSLCLTRTKGLRAESAIVILFDGKDEFGLRDAHDPIVLEFAEKQFAIVRQVTGSSLHLQGLWRLVLRHLVEAFSNAKRPLRIFIDGSACTRYILLAVIATTLKSGLASEVTVMYAEGTYQANQEIPGEHIVFTDGVWKSLAIPGLEGRYMPDLNRFYLVSLGFEGWKTMRAVTRADPDRVSVLHGDPGTQPDYAERSLRENRALLEHFQVPQEQIVSAHAGDAIQAWRALCAASLERPDRENSYFLCSGTKAHSLALALRAMTLQSPAVLYNLPESHRVMPIEPNGRYWRFDIRSLTVPRSAI